MTQWDLPETKPEPWDNKAFVCGLLDANERMGNALDYVYRQHPWIKVEVLHFLSLVGVEPPTVDEKLFVTYRRADGGPCLGEYAFMTSLDGLEEEDSDIIEERWVLDGRRIIPQPQPDDLDDYDDLYEEEEGEKVRKFKDNA